MVILHDTGEVVALVIGSRKCGTCVRIKENE